MRRALESVQGPALKLPLLEALLWLHLPQQPTVTPDLLSNIVHASFTTSLVPGYALSQIVCNLLDSMLSFSSSAGKLTGCGMPWHNARSCCFRM